MSSKSFPFCVLDHAGAEVEVSCEAEMKMRDLLELVFDEWAGQVGARLACCS
eukprot:SAG22_NODE_17_length_32684_cov_34.234095_25_plen_52_part_00